MNEYSFFLFFSFLNAFAKKIEISIKCDAYNVGISDKTICGKFGSRERKPEKWVCLRVQFDKKKRANYVVSFIRTLVPS